MELLSSRSIIVTCGPGGVGKTTTAAALGLAAAELGRRVVVVTIDPARRLADALGLGGELSNEPARVELDNVPGELWATMLDAKQTFDGVVTRHASNPDQAQRILENSFYRNISSALSGTHEYMAAERLFDLHHDSRFDLVVVDTPPTRNALDVLDAPERLTRFLDHRLYRALIMPTRGYLRVANAATQLFVKSAARVVGAEVVADAMAFFLAFDGMEAGFRKRSTDVLSLMRSDAAAFVMVCAPRHDSVAETHWLIGRLADRGLTPSALIVNRAHPEFGVPYAEAQRRRDESPAWHNLAELAQVAQAESALVAPLAALLAPAPVVTISLRATDIHALTGLRDVATDLLER